MPLINSVIFILLFLTASNNTPTTMAWRPWPHLFLNATTTAAVHDLDLGASKKYEGSSEFVHLQYHMGPVLTANITVHPIWYGAWSSAQNESYVPSSARSPLLPPPTLRLRLVAYRSPLHRPHRLQHHSRAVTARTRPLPINTRGGFYLLLTSHDVGMEDFCGNVCGFHYFTFPSVVGYTLPYAWVGNSGGRCPEVCAYPFAIPSYVPGRSPERTPNGDIGWMAWTGGGGSYTGQLLVDEV
ncbi:hypothetical protein HPP92_014637 [Vanilla planifolia]|uniref:Uncharacterized protein n=1 Tax=Vanilla planifolia TaxID=51239 RepID=A0A835UUA0_VANPL|nr:hypothetical protein HPP92_014637 [Vanilla planifolia]